MDAGPLIHLTEIGQIELLQVFEKLFITDAVWEETVGKGRVFQADIEKPGNIIRRQVSPDTVGEFIHKNRLENLHRGELECLCVCKIEQISLIITDDLSVREAARKLNITPIGSLGIIVRAYKLNCISIQEAESCMMSLYNSSTLFVTRTIIEMAIEQLHHKHLDD